MSWLLIEVFAFILLMVLVVLFVIVNYYADKILDDTFSEDDSWPLDGNDLEVKGNDQTNL